MPTRKILFFLNPASGTCDDNFQDEIESYFSENTQIETEFFTPDWDTDVKQKFNQKLKESDYETVVASGGDGTVTFVCENIYGTNIKLGILPTGSANGLAKNLNIPVNVQQALEIIEKGNTQKMSSLTVNGKFSVHLADAGINAAIIKQFESQEKRGIWGYFTAFKNVIFKQKRVKVEITTDNENFSEEVFMLVFSNGTGYGTGLTINPDGRFDDEVFEIVMVKKLSFFRGLKLYWTNEKPSPEYLQIHSCKKAVAKFKSKMHLQIDGEYLGLTQKVEAVFNEKYIEVIN